MPGHLLHLQLARELLSDSDGWQAPKWSDNPEAVNAFYHGAIGPDMGYFPGADTLLADLSHYVRPGVLVREMLHHAESDVEEAYAWGWASHLISDVEAHVRVVNPRCGEIVNGSSDRPAIYAESPATHIAVEVGLDAAQLRSMPKVDQIRLKSAFDESTIRFLRQAYLTTYDLDIDESRLIRSHHAVARFQALIFRFTALIGRRQLGLQLSWTDRLLLVAYLPAKWLTSIGTRSRAYGATHPDRPPGWVISETEDMSGSFQSTFAGHLANEFASLLEINVDTGAVDDPTYPCSARARHRLARRKR